MMFVDILFHYITADVNNIRTFWDDKNKNSSIRQQSQYFGVSSKRDLLLQSKLSLEKSLFYDFS